MTKPHEEEWVVGRDNNATVQSAGGRVCTARRAEDAAFIASAPDMARALMGMGEEKGGQWHSKHCDATSDFTCVDPSCKAVEAALRKAGVLP